MMLLAMQDTVQERRLSHMQRFPSVAYAGDEIRAVENICDRR